MIRTWLRPVGLLGCFMLSACGSSPPTRFYILNEIAPAAPALTATNQIPVRVEPVTIAPELDRPELVSRSGPNRVLIAGSERWAAPLSDQIRRVISDDLSARLPPGLVADQNEAATTDARRLLAIAIAEFYGDGTCAVTLRTGWSLTNPHATVLHGFELVQIPSSAPCAGKLPAAMSRALARMADDLAKVIAGN